MDGFSVDGIGLTAGVRGVGGGGVGLGLGGGVDELRAGQDDFLSVLGRVGGLGGRGGSGDQGKDEAREAAEKFVSGALVLPVLKQLRETDGAAEPFKASRGERMFRGLMDQVMADRIVGASSWPLVDRIAEQIGARRGGAAAQGGVVAREVRDVGDLGAG